MPEIDLDALGAQYREAKQAVPEHLRIQAGIELEQIAWLRKHRGVPADVLYDRTTGEPLDPELADIEARMKKAEADVVWCRGLVVACGEAYKGETFDSIAERNDANRAAMKARMAKALEG